MVQAAAEMRRAAVIEREVGGRHRAADHQPEALDEPAAERQLQRPDLLFAQLEHRSLPRVLLAVHERQVVPGAAVGRDEAVRRDPARRLEAFGDQRYLAVGQTWPPRSSS